MEKRHDGLILRYMLHLAGPLCDAHVAIMLKLYNASAIIISIFETSLPFKFRTLSRYRLPV